MSYNIVNIANSDKFNMIGGVIIPRNFELTGRTIIKTSEKEITSANIREILKMAFPIHILNRREIQYLRGYYKGLQDIRFRDKKYREEINNKVVINRAFEIVEFKKGFVFGEPVQLVQRGDCEFTDEDESVDNSSVAALNEYLQAENKEAIDAIIAEDMHVCGTAYRLVFPKADIAETSDFIDEAPFFLDALDPENTFVVYSSAPGGKSMLGVTYEITKDLETGLDGVRIAAYTDNKVFTIDATNASPNESTFLEDVEVKEDTNGVGKIPIIEYPLNPSRLGCFENVIDLLDAINLIASNRMDGVEQFIQSFIKFSNCEIDEDGIKRLKQDGAIIVRGTPGLPADVQILAEELDQSQTQTLVDDLYEAVLTICGVPDREASAGGNTGQALKIGQGWTNAETRAKATEVVFKKSEREFIKVVLAILRNVSSNKLKDNVKDLRVSDIDFTFTRNNTDSLLVKTQGLLNLLQAGIHPRISIERVGLFSDPERVYQDSLPYLEALEQEQEQTNMNSGDVPVSNQTSTEEALVNNPENDVQEN